LFNYEKLIYYNCIDIDSDWFGDDEINTKKEEEELKEIRTWLVVFRIKRLMISI